MWAKVSAGPPWRGLESIASYKGRGDVDGKKEAWGSLSRQDWIDHFNAKTWRSSSDMATPYINLAEYNIFYKKNQDDSWSYCLKRQDSPWGTGEEWSRERFGSGEEAKLALLKRFADILGKV